MEYEIKNGLLTVKISSLGAELLSVKFCGVEKLWQNDNNTWAGHAPILFPVAGHCSFVLDGKDYEMPFHGVVRNQEFGLEKIEGSSAVFSLTANDYTKRYYPYDFKFTVKYELKENGLYIDQTVKNLSDREMYFLLGAHESYNLPNGLGNYYLEFSEEESFIEVCECGGGLVDVVGKPYPTLKKLVLPEDYLQNNNTLILSGLKSKTVSVYGKEGKVYEVNLGGYNNLLLWHSPESKMVCIEPWQGLPDNVNTKTAEFSTKYGVEKLLKGGEKTFSRYIKYFK